LPLEEKTITHQCHLFVCHESQAELGKIAWRLGNGLFQQVEKKDSKTRIFISIAFSIELVRGMVYASFI